MPAPLRLVFLGSDTIARPLLDWLWSEGAALATIVGVLTQPDRAVGRGQQVTPNGIKTWALERGLPVLQPEKLTEEVRTQLAGMNPDVSLVMAYGHILKDVFIDTPRLGTLNLHASLLPNYRGASPIQSAIASGEGRTGVSLMRIVRRLDAGPVADTETVTIEKLDTAFEIEAKLAAACVPLVARNLPQLQLGHLGFTPQDDAAASYCRRLTKADGALDFNQPARALAARINGLFPWPGCATLLGGQVVKIGLAEALDSGVGGATDAGTIVCADESGVSVVTGSGVLRLLRLQRPGGRMLPAGEFLRGFPIAEGTLLPSHPMAPLVDGKPFKF